jgi:site-specific DNA recombinase
MTAPSVNKNAVAAIRISSVKQGLQGDSPEDQKQQIERFALARGIKIKKFFIFIESASKEQQPIQEAIDYCKGKNNNIQLFIIKSIDRFTRGGSYLYDHLKQQLDNNGVSLIDIYGIISDRQVNTLEHLDIKFDWSVYSPTKKAEILEAERAKDEMRDIMTRMIGAEIRYVRMGYRVRRAPFGYKNEKINTEHGKRVILIPHQEESKWIKKMYQYRLEGVMNDGEIVEKINNLGFKSRIFNRRDPENKTKVIGKRGGNPLILKQFWKYIQNPIYAGVNYESWTKDNPIKGKYKGLISIAKFNKANKGKITISEKNGKLSIQRGKIPEYLTKKQVKNPKFPYKKEVHCPKCNKPLFGSASRGSSGKYYPAYHCHKRGHYFRVPSKEFIETIETFVKDIEVSPKYIDNLKKQVIKLWKSKQETVQDDNGQVDKKIEDLRAQARSIAGKIRYLNSEISIGYMEKDLIDIEKEIQKLEGAKENNLDKENVNIEAVMEAIGFYLEHLEELLLYKPKPLKRAEYFSLLFEERPTYDELAFGTPKLVPFVNRKGGSNASLLSIGDPTESRTPLPRMRTWCPDR